jgi:hypothetical protein
LQVAHRILGILLAALAVQAILNGFAELGLITLRGPGRDKWTSGTGCFE